MMRAAPIAAKHFAWLAISLATGGTLIFYFADAPELLRSFADGEVSANALTCIAVFAGTTYGLAGFAREQVCTFMCPWPRLQGAIWDPEANIVNYRDYRGEQRTSAKKATELRLQGKPVGDLRRLRALRYGLPDWNRHPGGAELRLHQLRPLCRRSA